MAATVANTASASSLTALETANRMPSRVKFQIQVIAAKNLIAKDLNGYSDPFVTLAIGERQKEKTKVITKHLNPVWTDEIFSFTSDNPSRDKIEVVVWDWNRVERDRFLGMVTLSVREIFSQCMLAENLWGRFHTLEKRPNKGKEVDRGELLLNFCLLNDDGSPRVAETPSNGPKRAPASPIINRAVNRYVSGVSVNSVDEVPTRSFEAGKKFALRVNIIEAKDLPHFTLRKHMATISVQMGSTRRHTRALLLNDSRLLTFNESLIVNVPEGVSDVKVALHTRGRVMGVEQEVGKAKVPLLGLPVEGLDSTDQTETLLAASESPTPLDVAVESPNSLASPSALAAAQDATLADDVAWRTASAPPDVAPQRASRNSLEFDTERASVRWLTMERKKMKPPPPGCSLKDGRAGRVLVELSLIEGWVQVDGVDNTSEGEEGDDVDDDDEPVDEPPATPVAAPDPLEWSLFDEDVPCSLTKLHALTMQKDSKFLAAFYVAKNYTNTAVTDWDEDDRREVTYLMPKSAIVKANNVSEKWHYVVKSPGAGFILHVETLTPEVPYGESIVTKIQYYMCYRGPKQAYLRVTAQVEFTKSVNGMMKSMILRGSKNGMTDNYALYSQILKKFTRPSKGKGAGTGASGDSETAIIVPSGQSSSGRSLKIATYVCLVVLCVLLALLYVRIVNLEHHIVQLTQQLADSLPPSDESPPPSDESRHSEF